MSKEKKEKRSWLSRHKKVIIGSTAFVIVCTVTGILIYQNPDKAKEILTTAKHKVSSLFGKKSLFNDALIECTRIEGESIESISEKIIEINKEIKKKRKYTPCNHPSDVNQHLRHLPDGWNPSNEKILQGKEMGLDLMELRCTIVDNHKRRGAA